MKHVIIELVLAVAGGVFCNLVWPNPVLVLIGGLIIGSALAFAFVMYDLNKYDFVKRSSVH